MKINMKIKQIYAKNKDIVWNFGAFALYIGVQQIVIMPFISAFFSESEYSRIAVFLTVFNILVCIGGDEIGNTYLIRKKEYDSKNIKGDFILLFLTVLLFLLSAATLVNVLVLHIDLKTFMQMLVVLICGSIRYFFTAYLRGNQQFGLIFCANILYAMGALTGILLLRASNNFLLPFLLGELPAAAFILGVVIFNRSNNVSLRLSPEFGNTARSYLKLGLVSSLQQCVAYLDRLIVYPMLGAAAMSLYYSSTTVSKLSGLAINPVGGVLMARLSGREKDDRRDVTKKMLKYYPWLLIAIFAVNFIFIWLAAKLLYSQYYNDAVILFLPICVAEAFGGVNFLMKPVLLRFFSTSMFVVVNLIYAAAFIAGILAFSSLWGLLGYALSIALAKIIQSLCYVAVLTRSGKTDKKRRMYVSAFQTKHGS